MMKRLKRSISRKNILFKKKKVVKKSLKINYLWNTLRHCFHVIVPSYSYLPALLSITSALAIVHFVFYMHADSTYFVPGYLQSFVLNNAIWKSGVFFNSYHFHLTAYFIILVLILLHWMFRICAEARSGFHTYMVQRGLRIGAFLFIVSEVMFFFGLFWSYFHYALNPAPFLGNIWPPVGINVPPVFGMVFISTIFLLTSGFFVSEAHRMLYVREVNYSLPLAWANFAGSVFSIFQTTEWLEVTFALSSGVYGSIFFTLTGAHSLHVAIGNFFLLCCWIVSVWGHPTWDGQVGFDFAAWYWHFVDIVWLGVLVSVYGWGGASA